MQQSVQMHISEGVQIARKTRSAKVHFAPPVGLVLPTAPPRVPAHKGIGWRRGPPPTEAGTRATTPAREAASATGTARPRPSCVALVREEELRHVAVGIARATRVADRDWPRPSNGRAGERGRWW